MSIVGLFVKYFEPNNPSSSPEKQIKIKEKHDAKIDTEAAYFSTECFQQGSVIAIANLSSNFHNQKCIAQVKKIKTSFE